MSRISPRLMPQGFNGEAVSACCVFFFYPSMSRGASTVMRLFCCRWAPTIRNLPSSRTLNYIQQSLLTE